MKKAEDGPATSRNNRAEAASGKRPGMGDFPPEGAGRAFPDAGKAGIPLRHGPAAAPHPGPSPDLSPGRDLSKEET